MLIGQDITIIGAGIGGLAAAVALAMRGARVTVLEQAEAVREVGAGIQLSPNGVAVLDALGLGEALRAATIRSKAVTLLDGPSGREVVRLDFLAHRPDKEFRLVHRADLIQILLQRAQDLGVVVETGQRVSGVTSGFDSVQIALEGGAREAGFVIGADGLHSVVRPVLNGAAKPFFTGQVAWRAIVPGSGPLPEGAQVFMGPGRHMVVYPLRGGEIVNIVAVEERSEWAEEGWHIRDDPAALRRAFARFCRPVQDLLAQVDEVHIWGLFRHPVASHWAGERLALLGDAAHPTLPFMAQGAVMALEDAWVLAESLAQVGLDEGPMLYQAQRLERARKIVSAANANARNYHYANPALRFLGHPALRLAGSLAPRQVLGRFDWIYDHDVTRGG